MIKALIIDDERLARKELTTLLEEHDEVKIIGESHNAERAIRQIEALKPDLIFLDVQMPGKNGFELLEELSFVPQVIFTTAYDEFAIKAFEVNALDYLLKPIQPDRLTKALNKLEKNMVLEEKTSEPEKILQPNAADLASNEELDDKLGPDAQVFVKEGEKCWFVKLKDVMMFESDGNYVRVFFGEQRPMILKSLNSLEEKLDSRVFFRANRKYILNLEWVVDLKPWENGGLMASLKDGTQIEISRRQSSKLKHRMSL